MDETLPDWATRESAAAALAAFGQPAGASRTLVAHGVAVVYRVELACGTAALRMSGPGEATGGLAGATPGVGTYDADPPEAADTMDEAMAASEAAHPWGACQPHRGPDGRAWVAGSHGGGAVTLTSWVPGTPPVMLGPRLLERLGAALRGIHEANERLVATAVRRARTPEARVAAGLAAWLGAWRDTGRSEDELGPLVEAADRIVGTIRRLGARAAYVHGDPQTRRFRIDGDRVGLVGFAAGGVGLAADDLAAIFAEVCARPDADALLDALRRGYGPTAPGVDAVRLLAWLRTFGTAPAAHRPGELAGWARRLAAEAEALAPPAFSV